MVCPRPALTKALTALTVVAATCASDAAHAASSTIVLRVDGACPDAVAVNAAVGPLLPQWRVATDAPGQSVHDVVIRDLGAVWTLSVDGSERRLEDPLRDCRERAGDASVAIALELDPPRTGQPLERVPPPHELHVDFAASGGVSTSLFGGGGVGAGGALRLTVGGERLGATFGVAGVSPIEIASGDVRVRVTRVPIDAGVRGSLPSRGGAVLGGELGVALAPLLAEGLNLPRNRSASGLDLGVRLAPTLTVPLSRSVAAFVTVEAMLVPQPARLSVTARGDVGPLPVLWLGAGLGLSFRVR